MQAIGYRELAEVFPLGVGRLGNQGALIDCVRKKIKTDSRRYAKKQYTFMKDIPGASFCPLDDDMEMSETLVRKITAFCSRIHLT